MTYSDHAQAKDDSGHGRFRVEWDVNTGMQIYVGWSWMSEEVLWVDAASIRPTDADNWTFGFSARNGGINQLRPGSSVLWHHDYKRDVSALPEAEQKAWLDGVSFPRAAGCVGYDIVRATDAADHFVVIESWPSKGARLAHTLETDSYEESVYSDATVEEVFRGPGRLA